MAIVTRVVRVANPRRKVKRVRRKKAAKTTKRKSVKRTASKRRVTKKKVVRRKRNPVPVLIELGAINPKRRKKNVAKRRIKRRRKVSNPKRRRVVRRVARKVTRRRRTRRTRKNPVVVVTRRRRNSHRRVHARRRRHNGMRRRRNPSIFGRSSGKDLLMMIGGGLLGVAATKFLPTLLPSGITAGLGGGPVMSLLLTAAGAFGASWLAQKVSKELGEAVLFGGLMQAASAALTAFAPPALSARLALSGIGDIVPGNYVVPQNPMKLPMVISTGNGGMGALRRGGNFR